MVHRIMNNGSKCKVMYFGKDNPKNKYVIKEDGSKDTNTKK